MRRGNLHLFPLISILVLFSSISHGQAWSGILSPSRAVNWGNAGLPATLPDGETTPNPWTPPTRTQSGSTVNPSGSASTDLSNINTALSNCSNGQYVLLGPGTFLIQGTVNAYVHSCTLRGSGAQSTILNMSGSGVIWMGAAWTGGSCSPTSGSNYAAGSTSITCPTGTLPAVGDVAWLNQCNTGYSGSGCTGTPVDNGGLFVCSGSTNCMTEPSGSGPYNSQYQVVLVTSVNTSTGAIGFTPAIYMPNWAYAQSPTLTWNNPAYDGFGVGIEDMTLYQNGTGASIQMQNTYASWVKGVRLLTSSGAVISMTMSTSLNGLVANTYAFNNTALDSSIGSTTLAMTSVSGSLILNNIWIGSPTWDSDGGNSGNVLAFNLGRDAISQYSLNSFYDHHAYSSFDLFEANQVGELDEDDTWGTHDLNTYFRNYTPCFDAPYQFGGGSNGSPRGMEVGNYHRFENYVGNAIGILSKCPAYQSVNDGAIFQISTGDSLVATTMMRWGNVSVVEQSSDTPSNSGIRFVSGEIPSSLPSLITSLSNFVPSNDNLPCSFFLAGYSSTTCSAHPNGGTGLSWWKVCTSWTTFPTSCASTQTQPFPLSGPDVNGGPYVNGYAYDTPSAIAWQYLPIDTTYQNSYTITGSSWSGGTETLTVSGLPSGSLHIMGAFQLSGVNSACTSGATFGGNSEILMTGSNVGSGTIQYALASNPGVSCGGTMKFPDVRQFDERVYQNDSGGDPAVNPPTGLNAVVQ